MLPIHVEIWIASRLLTKSQETFTANDLKHLIKQEFDDSRVGLTPHISSYCVASTRANPGKYRYLTRVDTGLYRIFREGDSVDDTKKNAPLAPDPRDIPEKYQQLLAGSIALSSTIQDGALKKSGQNEYSRKIIIDGSNVANYGVNVGAKENAKIKNIELVMDGLKGQGLVDIKVICDANLRWVIDDPKLFEEMIDNNQVIQVPAKTDADNWFFKYAKEFNAKVVSNDTFKKWVERDIWVRENAESFRVPFMIVDGVVKFENLETGLDSSQPRMQDVEERGFRLIPVDAVKIPSVVKPVDTPTKVEATIDVHGLIFRRVCEIEPERDPSGKIVEYMPQGDYEDQSAKLHQYGDGSFSRFRIPGNETRDGVYLVYSNERLMYVGETENLAVRFNQGYGNISPRACYEGGQQTNCRINKLILDEIKNGKNIALYYIWTNDRKQIEAQLRNALKPVWNKEQSLVADIEKPSFLKQGEIFMTEVNQLPTRNRGIGTLARGTNKDKILDLLHRNPQGFCDDCIEVRSGVSPRQQVNSICGRLVSSGVILRENKVCVGCGKYKIVRMLKVPT
jgi:hypothetical protein